MTIKHHWTIKISWHSDIGSLDGVLNFLNECLQKRFPSLTNAPTSYFNLWFNFHTQGLLQYSLLYCSTVSCTVSLGLEVIGNVFDDPFLF